jgi:hypothetical protein
MSELYNLLAADPELTIYVAAALVWCLLWALAGARLAGRIDRPVMGFAVCFVFGVFGLIYVGCAVLGRKPEPGPYTSRLAYPPPRIRVRARRPWRMHAVE